MKKWLLLAISTLLITNAHAQSWCGYKDFFHLSSETHPALYFVEGASEQDVILQFVGPRSFVINDGWACRPGHAHVTVAYDAANWCVLDIKDGPWMNHPVITASCNGMRYLGLTYDGINSYSYSINLD
jgi:hypothetical protein